MPSDEIDAAVAHTQQEKRVPAVLAAFRPTRFSNGKLLK